MGGGGEEGLTMGFFDLWFGYGKLAPFTCAFSKLRSLDIAGAWNESLVNMDTICSTFPAEPARTFLAGIFHLEFSPGYCFQCVTSKLCTTVELRFVHDCGTSLCSHSRYLVRSTRFLAASLLGRIWIVCSISCFNFGLGTSLPSSTTSPSVTPRPPPPG